MSLAHPLDLKVAARTAGPRAVRRAGGHRLCLGIGITTAVFSIFNGARALLPFPHPEQRPRSRPAPPARVRSQNTTTGVNGNQVFSAFGGARNWSAWPRRIRFRRALMTMRPARRGVGVFGARPWVFWVPGCRRTRRSRCCCRRSAGSSSVVHSRLSVKMLRWDGEPVTRRSRDAVQLCASPQRRVRCRCSSSSDPATRGSLTSWSPTCGQWTASHAGPCHRGARALGQTLAREFGNNHGVERGSRISK